MKKHKFCFALLFLQVCSLGFAESRQHRRFGGGNGKSPRLHAGAIERDEYSGKKCAFEAQRGLAQARDHASHSGSCPHCHRNRGASVAAESDLHDTRVARAPKRPLEHFDAVVKRARVDEDRAPHHAAVRKRPLLARVSAREAANSPDMAPYGAPQQAAYPPQGQDPGMGAPPGAYGAAPAQYPGPGQPEYAPQGPAQYPQQPQDAYAGAPAPQAAPYTPEQYPAPGSLPPPAGQYPAPYPGMAPDGVNAPQDQMAPAQYPYPNQGLAPSPFNQGSGLSSSHESDPNDVHNSWKCMLL